MRFAFGLHLHQPVGNFDSVFAQHLEDVYRPLLEHLVQGEALPVTFHVSGPLLRWLEERAADWVDRLGRLVADGQVELLASGYDEPILAALSRADRADQIGRMREHLLRRFGAVADGLWLTERVWEPDLASDLAAAGIRYTLVDDRHFLVSGFERAALARPWRTEHDGASVALLAIDERLRYLVPFRPHHEFRNYIATLRESGHTLAVLADDGEKFGGWPGTKDWVYTEGWLRGFTDELRRLREEGLLTLVTCGRAVEEVPSAGLAYLPTASYREMEGWSLPPEAGARLADLEARLDESTGANASAHVRGGHWRHFLVKYPEANRLHKTMARLSTLCRERGDPVEVRRLIGEAQCNDAYWHGVFGGLYLPFLRGALWARLAEAEGRLREGEGLAWTIVDIDLDGHEDILVHSPAFSAWIAPARGGGIEALLRFDTRENLVDTLTRRHELYHKLRGSGEPPGHSTEGMASIHDLEEAHSLERLPPRDVLTRALGLEQILSGDNGVETLRDGVSPYRHWAGTRCAYEVHNGSEHVDVILRASGFEKRIRSDAAGQLDVALAWDVPDSEEAALFVSELSLIREMDVESDAEQIIQYPILTMAKSERGLDEVHQGVALALGWSVTRRAGRWRMRFNS